MGWASPSVNPESLHSAINCLPIEILNFPSLEINPSSANIKKVIFILTPPEPLPCPKFLFGCPLLCEELPYSAWQGNQRGLHALPADCSWWFIAESQALHDCPGGGPCVRPALLESRGLWGWGLLCPSISRSLSYTLVLVSSYLIPQPRYDYN